MADVVWHAQAAQRVRVLRIVVLALVVLGVVLISGVAAHFPTLARVAHWVEEELRRLEQERQFG